MKFKDYIRLSRISIKSRKKSTRNTIFGLSFSLILLVPIIFFVIALNVDLKQKVNEEKSLYTFNILTSNSNYRSEPNEQYILNNLDIEKVLNTEGISEVFTYETLYYRYRSYDNMTYIKLEIDNRPYEYFSQDLQNSNGAIKNSIKVLDEKNDQIIPKAYLDDFQKKGIDVLVGPGFKGDKKGQIIISEKLLSTKNIRIEDVIGKKFSLYSTFEDDYNLNIRIDNDNDPNNTYVRPDYPYSKQFKVIDDFEIVGVIKEEYYKLNSLTVDEPHLIISSSSVYEEGTIKYSPIIKEFDDESGHNRKSYVVTFPEDVDKIQKKAKEDKMVPLLCPAIRAFDYKYMEVPCKNYVLSYENFDYASQADDVVTGIIKDIAKSDRVYNSFVDYYFATFKNMSKMGLYVSIALLIFGGIILFATLLNLYNTINYSVESRKNYIGMMRAIGQQNVSIIKSYIVEILLIFSRAFFWILIFSAAISYLFVYGVDKIFSNFDASMLPIAIHLNFMYYFVTLGGTILFAIIIAIAFSYISCRSVTRKSILDVLVEEK